MSVEVMRVRGTPGSWGSGSFLERGVEWHLKASQDVVRQRESKAHMVYARGWRAPGTLPPLPPSASLWGRPAGMGIPRPVPTPSQVLSAPLCPDDSPVTRGGGGATSPQVFCPLPRLLCPSLFQMSPGGVQDGVSSGAWDPQSLLSSVHETVYLSRGYLVTASPVRLAA